MPNRWESSGRPLFVKTVYVNGNRHAILSHEDPLLRARASFFKKTSRPNSSFSLSSDESITSCQSQESASVDKNFHGRKNRGWKDLSSELQDCLVKLRLASNKGEKAISSSLTDSTPETETKRQKWGRGRKKKIQNAKDRFKENEPKDCQDRDMYRYVYKFNNNKGKKTYCFVKISSEPPGVILDSVCDGSQDLLKSENNNLVISAAFHDLIMPPYKTEKISTDKEGYLSTFEDSADLYWNTYLTRPMYNSLSERVIQWLDRTKKRNRTQHLERKSENVSEHSASRRTFLNKNESGKQRRNVSRKERLKDFEGEVEGEPNVETTLSVGKVECDMENDEALARCKYIDATCEESLSPEASGWEMRINQEKEIDVDSHSVTVTCRCEKNRRCYANGFEIATQEFPERNQKSIDIANVTRTQPISVWELSPQQKAISREQMLWASVRDIERPQLHIFIPTVPSKGTSEESLSECDPQFTEL